jgi:hypothetical protein
VQQARTAGCAVHGFSLAEGDESYIKCYNAVVLVEDFRTVLGTEKCPFRHEPCALGPITAYARMWCRANPWALSSANWKMNLLENFSAARQQ